MLSAWPAHRTPVPGGHFSLWRDQLGATPPFDVGPDTLFVCFVANAECACHLALGWPLPARL